MTCNKRCLWVSFVGDKKKNNNKMKGYCREVRQRDVNERVYGVVIARRPHCIVTIITL